jgi:hypothetical protein
MQGGGKSKWRDVAFLTLSSLAIVPVLYFMFYDLDGPHIWQVYPFNGEEMPRAD